MDTEGQSSISQEEIFTDGLARTRTRLTDAITTTFDSTDDPTHLIDTCLNTWESMYSKDMTDTQAELHQALANARVLASNTPELVQVVESQGLSLDDFMKVNAGSSLLYIAEKRVAAEINPQLEQVLPIELYGGGTIEVGERTAEILKANEEKLKQFDEIDGIPVFMNGEEGQDIARTALSLVLAAGALPNKEHTRNILFVHGLSAGKAYFDDHARNLVLGIDADPEKPQASLVLPVTSNIIHEGAHSEQPLLPGLIREVEALHKESQKMGVLTALATQGKLTGIVEDQEAFAKRTAFQGKFVFHAKLLPMLQLAANPDTSQRLLADHNIHQYSRVNDARLGKSKV